MIEDIEKGFIHRAIPLLAFLLNLILRLFVVILRALIRLIHFRPHAIPVTQSYSVPEGSRRCRP
jgi:hypothetical protein